MRASLAVAIVFGWMALSATAAHALTADEEKQREKPFVYTNADLPPAPPASRFGSVAPPADSPPALPPPSAQAPVAPPPALPSYDGHRDLNGNGEGWWRLQAAELDLLILDARLKAEELHVQYVRGKTIADPTLARRSREATELLVGLEKLRERLPEDLRRAGGFPGWLRGAGVEPLTAEPLPPPVPEAVVHGEGITLSWKSVLLAEFYIVEAQCLDCCGPLGDCEIRSLDVTGTSARFPFDSAAAGRWRVRALDAAGFFGGWSDWSRFDRPES